MINNIQRTSQFKRDFKKYRRKHFDLQRIKNIIVLIVHNEYDYLDRRYDNHALHGNWQGYQELHVDNNNDILLVYRVSINESYLGLARLNTHNRIFGK